MNLFGGSDPLSEMLGNLGGNKVQRETQRLDAERERLAKERESQPKAKPKLVLPQLRSRRIEEKLFIRAEDVGLLLEALGDDRLKALAKKLKES